MYKTLEIKNLHKIDILWKGGEQRYKLYGWRYEKDTEDKIWYLNIYNTRGSSEYHIGWYAYIYIPIYRRTISGKKKIYRLAIWNIQESRSYTIDFHCFIKAIKYLHNHIQNDPDIEVIGICPEELFIDLKKLEKNKEYKYAEPTKTH